MIAATALLATSSAFANRPETDDAYRYLLANPLGARPNLPTDTYIPFDWVVGEVPAGGEGVRLTWDKAALPAQSRFRLRITSATDVREVCVLTVKTAVSSKTIGELDMRFAHYMQPFELTIDPADAEAVMQEGVVVQRISGTKPFWFFARTANTPSAPDAFLPHLLAYQPPDAGPPDRWKDRLLSLDSVQTFGWMQGVVWDGLHEMSQHSAKAKAVLKDQLALYLSQNSLVYANLNNVKTVGKISTVESILPFAILAQTNPAHPLLQTAIAFCESHANAAGVIADGTGTTGSPADRMLKTEECYTVSYPLAVLAKTLKRPELAQLAIQTLQSRINTLEKGTSIYQRGTEQGDLYFKNWGRGVAWYLLGLAKTLAHLPNSDQKQTLVRSFQNAVRKVLTYQQPNGLWYNFFHTPETGFETSGTAGIAAALTYGCKQGFLDATAKKAAQKAQKALLPYMTPDGYLTGTAQVNKGGDALQHNGFRVLSPYTLGFLAHLDRN